MHPKNESRLRASIWCLQTVEGKTWWWSYPGQVCLTFFVKALNLGHRFFFHYVNIKSNCFSFVHYLQNSLSSHLWSSGGMHLSFIFLLRSPPPQAFKDPEANTWARECGPKSSVQKSCFNHRALFLVYLVWIYTFVCVKETYTPVFIMLSTIFLL